MDSTTLSLIELSVIIAALIYTVLSDKRSKIRKKRLDAGETIDFT